MATTLILLATDPTDGQNFCDDYGIEAIVITHISAMRGLSGKVIRTPAYLARPCTALENYAPIAELGAQ